ncbi:hypothetical protein [Gloeocapsa sp. PCC 73106]|uniref:hypothetical protein n=1 Tax=Gloeocapsa sp. PCC 73106 TaxID=102232 RepID=UPI0002ACB848|nr:hypothetical protein [Gloeocapsa sp. PCC 73106]ELR99162.1 hypothetical protein GLO73106DRAFT_00030110 [Gloeocapsa sp. PCC 73106]
MPEYSATEFIASISSLENDQEQIYKIYESTKIDAKYMGIDIINEEAISKKFAFGGANPTETDGNV